MEVYELIESSLDTSRSLFRTLYIKKINSFMEEGFKKCFKMLCIGCVEGQPRESR